MLHFVENKYVTAENKFWELFQYHLNGAVREGRENGKKFWDVEFKSKVNGNLIRSLINKWTAGGFGSARHVAPNKYAPFGSLLFVEK